MKKRESNIELLRIVSMFMIVAHHFAVHGKFMEQTILPFINYIWIELLSSLGKIGVNIFVIISGFFLINSKKFNINKFIRISAQILFYSITVFIIFVSLRIEPFSVKSLIKHILGYPVWWFTKTYLVLYLIHPYINKLLNSLNQSEYKKLIVFSTIILSIIPTITSINVNSGLYIWFIYLYSLGAYISKYPIDLNLKANKYLLTSILLYFLIFSLVIVFYFIGLKIPLFVKHSTYLFEINKLPTLVISLLLFMSFKNMKIKYSKLINTIGSATFGIYLIHDNEYMHRFLWQTLFKNATYSNTHILIPYSLFAIITVFVVCLIIDLLRKYLIEKKCLKFFDTLSNFIEKKLIKF